MMLLATLAQIAAAPKPKAKAPRRASERSIKSRIERERSKPNHAVGAVSYARRTEMATAKWRNIFLGRALNVEQAADLAGCKVAGAYSAIYRLKQNKQIRVARKVHEAHSKKDILYWTWNEEAE